MPVHEERLLDYVSGPVIVNVTVGLHSVFSFRGNFFNSTTNTHPFSPSSPSPQQLLVILRSLKSAARRVLSTF